MGANSEISWTDHTFNPWEGCTKVSPGCAHCYAEARDMRFTGGIHWGKGAPRRRTSAANWKQPLKWDREAAPDLKAEHPWFGPRPRVFCASLADWLDDEVEIAWLADLLDLIRQTPNLDWLLLTKRPQNWSARLHAAFRHGFDGDEWLSQWLDGNAPANVWLGTTAEDQVRADERIPVLLSIPAKVRFLSCEPLLGSVDISAHRPRISETLESPLLLPDWVICGGESGKGARPMHPDWARGLRDQCAAAGIAFHFKQWGEHSAEFRPGVEVVMDTLKPNQAVTYGDGATNHVLYTRVGKIAAGRLLDGAEHNAFPEVRA